MAMTMSATAARVHFGELMQKVVHLQEPVFVEKSGVPQVVMLSIDQYKRLLAGQQEPSWETLLAAAQLAAQTELNGRILPPPEDVIRQLREERDGEVNYLY